MTTSEPNLLDKMLFQIGFIKMQLPTLSPEDLDVYIRIVHNLLRQRSDLRDVLDLDAMYKKFERTDAKGD